ncbi:MAG TPA: hypothetical protein DFR83_29240 [Deltaproteobacteria bacterium]|nr:hypothetical protein [Deltaproteobacteria bacterium]
MLRAEVMMIGWSGSWRWVGLGCLGIACSDYNISDKDEPSEPGEAEDAVPDVVVDPESFAITGLCGTEDTELAVINVGLADLDVFDVIVDGRGWSVDTSPLPVVLAPGLSVELPVTAGVGSATIHIDTSDPDEPRVSVPADAAADEAPLIAITSPADGAVLPVGGSSLSASVLDSEDGLDELEVTWESDPDGIFAIDFADASGAATANWSGRTAGPHTITATVEDTCGNATSAVVEVCQDEGYTSDELDLSAWQFEGSAEWDTTNDWLQLTAVESEVVGSAFATDDVVSGDNIEIRFNFYMGDGTGADGISLTALDVDRMSGFLGGTGCGLGYGGDAPCTEGPALPGWSIEVDTFYNADADPTEEDHLMFTFDGDVDSAVIWSELPEMEDTGWHEMVVTVADPNVRVEIDGVVYLDEVASGHFGFPAYVGFTAGTGGETNRHLIDSLEVTGSICDN